ncbi:MAG: hypothetical protein M1818_002053 [Claussenomyces sp. TS43310]|nr:MAG: hypothetical protein M1818_002053 [Claussenomyces sp. TS43310]
MAYNQSYYQPPSRPYNGSAARPPGAPQPYPPAQDYTAQGPYDQYTQDDGYGGAYNDHGGNGGYAQDQGYDNGYQQPINGGGRGGGGGGGRGQYPPQQQEYYGNAGPPRGGRGGDPRSQGRNGTAGRGGPPYAGRPPPADAGRGAYDSRGPPRTHPNGHGPPSLGRGGRPVPLERSGSSDPGSQRRPGAPPQRSPQEMSWDNPFPGFPAAKKKASKSEEQQIADQMGKMSMNDAPRPRTGGGSNGQEQRGPPGPLGPNGPSGPNGYGRHSEESHRGMPSRGPQSQHPQPGYGAQRPGPAPVVGPRGPPRQNDYGQSYGQDYGPSDNVPASPMNGSFGPPSRANTMPSEMNMNAPMGGHSGNGGPAPGALDVGPSAPYNGPVGRMPPRPSTATGVRPIPQRMYPPQQQQVQRQQPPQQTPQQPPQQPPQQQQLSIHANHQPELEDDYAYHNPTHSISTIYDDYYHSHSYDAQKGRFSGTSNSSLANGHRRGMSMEGQVQQVNGYPAMNHQKSQPDFRAQVQPQSAVYEMVGDAPPVPNANPQQAYQNERYDQYGNMPPSQNGPSGPIGGGSYGNRQAAQQDQRQIGPGSQDIPPVQIPYQNGTAPNVNSAPRATAPTSGPEVLPSHPPPVRAGLLPNAAVNQTNIKPPPVRNYNGTTAVVKPPNPSRSQQPSGPPRPAAPPPVTHDELERLRVMIKANPTDQASQLLLARKLVEASEILVQQMPEAKARNKARERYVTDAHKLLKRLCSTATATPSSPQADAMFFLADCLGRGSLGTEPDNKEAFILYQSAAKAGHAAGAYRTAVCCELGQEEGGGTRKDPLKAIQWYKRAATLGDTPAMYKMGMIQLKGLLGQPKDPREAITWLKRAAEKADTENPHALHELGLLYEAPQPGNGGGAVVRDEAYSLTLFTQAAELGYKFSQFRLGCAYEYGLFNLPIDPRQSILWYSRAAVQEEHQSELALSGWYLTGSEGVIQQSDTEAYLWARKAAMAGLAKAEYAMGYFTEVGIGAPSDLDGAKRWYWRAAAQNFPKARERLEDLKRGGSRPQLKGRERISRSKIGKQNEGECSVM